MKCGDSQFTWLSTVTCGNNSCDATCTPGDLNCVCKSIKPGTQGLQCNDPSATCNTNGYCVKPLPLGGACQSNSDCASPLLCDPNSQMCIFPSGPGTQ